MAEARRKDLLKAAAAQDPAAFLKIYDGHRLGAFNLHECIQGMPAEDVAKVWGSLAGNLPSHLPETGEENEDYIEAVALFGASTLKEGSAVPPKEMTAVIGLLYDCLIKLDFGTPAQDAIARLCEAWFLGKMEDAEQYVPATIVYLLTKSVHEIGKLADVKRVCAMKESLELLDLRDESSRSLQDALLKAATHPNYVMHKEGQGLLSHAFTISPALARGLHRTIKGQLPRVRSSMLLAYGEIYHAAWKKASGQTLHAIEHDCLQDLANHCVHASSSSLASAIRKFLSVFHSKKKYQKVDEMLFRIYEPILWRALKVANPLVRKQAALLFVEAFPIQNPEAAQAEFEQFMQVQLNALNDLLLDEEPSVREVGVQCVSRVLSVYWDLLPLQTCNSFLVRLVTEFSFDASSPGVRAATLRGLRFVLDNHMSHPIMQGLAVNLRPHIHDTSERVRVAMCDLLLKVSSVKGIAFYDIVPLEDVLLRLAIDSNRNSVATRLTKLLLPSYLGANKTPPELMKRLCAMLKQNVRAAEVFYKEAALQVSPQQTVNFLVMVYHALLVGAQQETSDKAPKGKGGRGKRHADEEDEEEEERSNVRPDKGQNELLQLSSGLLSVMAAAMHSLRPQLDREKWHSLRDYIAEEIDASSLLDLIAILPGATAASSIWSVCSAMPQAAPANQASECLAKLMRLPDVAAWASQAGPMIECLVSWGMHKDLFREVEAGISALLGAPKAGGNAKKSRKNERAQSRGGESAWLHEELLLWCVHYILASERCRARLFLSSKAVDGLQAALESCRGVVVESIQGKSSCPASSEGALDCLLLLGKVRLHQACSDGGDDAEASPSTADLSGLVEWCVKKIVPKLAAPAGAEGSKEKKKDAVSGLERRAYVAEACKRVLLVCAEAATINKMDAALAKQVCALIESAVAAASPSEEAHGVLQQAAYKALFQIQKARLCKDEVLSCVRGLLAGAPKAHLKVALGVIREALNTTARPVPEGRDGAEAASVVNLLDAMVEACVARIERDPEGADDAACLDEVVKAIAAAGASPLSSFLAHLRRSLTSVQDLSTLHVLLSLVHELHADEAPRQVKEASRTDKPMAEAVSALLNTMKDKPDSFKGGASERCIGEVSVFASEIFAKVAVEST